MQTKRTHSTWRRSGRRCRLRPRDSCSPGRRQSAGPVRQFTTVVWHGWPTSPTTLNQTSMDAPCAASLSSLDSPKSLQRQLSSFDVRVQTRCNNSN